MLHPLNVRKHFHVNIGKMGSSHHTQSKVFKSRDDANAWARQMAKKESEQRGKPFKGGSFGSNSLAFYAIADRYVEVKRCEEHGPKHREQT